MRKAILYSILFYVVIQLCYLDGTIPKRNDSVYELPPLKDDVINNDTGVLGSGRDTIPIKNTITPYKGNPPLDKDLNP